MGVGIALGGFMDGFSKGVGLGQDILDNQRRAKLFDEQEEDRKRKLAEDDEDRKYELEQRARDQKLQAKQDAETAALDQIRGDARTTFQQGVDAGTFKPDDFDAFFSQYTVPKMYHEMLLAGDEAGASRLKEWGDSDAAKRGGRLFASALFKAQSGDPGGALDDAIKAGQVKGYITSDFAFKGKEDIKDANGSVVGYRITMTDGDGNEVEQDVATGDVPKVVATFANPEAAWQTQQAKASAATKRKEDLEDYATKKTIDAATDGKGGEQRSKAIESLRKRMADAALTGGGQSFDDLAPEQQEKLIADELALQNGSRETPLPQPDVLVDSQMGTPVPVAAPAGNAPPDAGLGNVPQAPVGVTQQPARSTAPGIGTPPAPVQLSPDQQRRVEGAAELAQGGDRAGAIRLLQDAGIPRDRWPQGLASPQAGQMAGLALPYGQ